MPTIQTSWADGRDTAPRPQTSGAVHVAKFVLNIPTTIVNADVVEIGLLQPFAHIVDAILVPEGAFAGVTCTVGLMTGEGGDPVTPRTVGGQIFAAATALTGTVRNTLADGFNIQPSESTRGIGVDFSADVAGAGGKRLTLILFYVQ